MNSLVADKDWNRVWSHFDRDKNNPSFQAVRGNRLAFHKELITRILENDPKAAVDHNQRTVVNAGRDSNALIYEIVCQHVFQKLGSHTWYVDSDTASSMLTAKVDDDLNGIQIPYDSMAIAFERGFELAPGVPLRSIRIFAPRSRLAVQTMEELVDLGGSPSEFISFYADPGRDKHGHYSPDTEDKRIGSWQLTRPYSPVIETDLIGPDETDDSPKLFYLQEFSTGEFALFQKAIKLACACLILYAHRPEYLLPFQLPRSQRFQVGDAESRKNFKRVTLPAYKRVEMPGTVHSETGRTVAGHYRGWVYRVLRHERYKRKPDGSFNTVVVPPCVVNGGPEDE